MPDDDIKNDIANKIGSVRRPVKGGSFANDASLITASTRGSLSPESCSVFTGFRPVLVRVK
jgi:hypothetical protein